MLENLSEEIRQCHQRAEKCARQAEATSDKALRADYLHLEAGWLKLARSYELRQRLTLFINEVTARQRNDLDQGACRSRANAAAMQWEPIASAPFDRDLELAVLDQGDVHALVFPCRRILGGWINSQTRARVEVWPSHWRDWQPKD
jgi:hypothetical protein